MCISYNKKVECDMRCFRDVNIRTPHESIVPCTRNKRQG